MNTSGVTDFFKSVQSYVIKHSPEILTGFGIVGMIGAGVMAVEVTPKVMKKLEAKKKEEHVDKLPPVEVVKVAWRSYVPAIVTGATSAACLIKANSINTRRNAALATAYNLSRTAYSEYKDKVVETIGEKKEQLIKDAIAQDKLDKDPVENREVIVTEGGNTLCYDGVFGRYFYSDQDTIIRAINRLNREIYSNMYASLNDFYNEIGLDPVGVGDDLGWKIDDGEIEPFFSSKLANGRPCLVVTFNITPKYEYTSLY